MAHRFALALATAALIATPVMAVAQQTEQRTVGVTYADLDLTSADGRAELDRRIDRAARAACAIGETDLGTRVMTREKRACYRDARTQLDQRFARVLADGRNAG